MKRKYVIVLTPLLIAIGAATWWFIGRRAFEHRVPPQENERESLLPDRTPPVTPEARPIILTPSRALHQEGQDRTVEFRVRAVSDLLADDGDVSGTILMDGPGSLQSVEEADLATILVFVPAALAEQFRSEAKQPMARYLRDKRVRVHGRIQRERIACESSDGHLVSHARVKIDLTSLDQIGIVPSTIQPGSERDAADRQDRERSSRLQVSAEALLEKIAPALDAKQWMNHGEPVVLEQVKGRVVLLDFWGQWCSPCVRKLPRVQELYEKYNDRGFIALGVHTPDGSENLKSFLEEKKITFPVMLDTGVTAERYGVEVWPTYFLIDKRGHLTWGFENAPPTDAQIESLLAH